MDIMVSCSKGGAYGTVVWNNRRMLLATGKQRCAHLSLTWSQSILVSDSVTSSTHMHVHINSICWLFQMTVAYEQWHRRCQKLSGITCKSKAKCAYTHPVQNCFKLDGHDLYECCSNHPKYQVELPSITFSKRHENVSTLLWYYFIPQPWQAWCNTTFYPCWIPTANHAPDCSTISRFTLDYSCNSWDDISIRMTSYTHTWPMWNNVYQIIKFLCHIVHTNWWIYFYFLHRKEHHVQTAAKECCWLLLASAHILI